MAACENSAGGGEGTGKRGGVRIVYAVRGAHEIWLLTIYGKSDVADIPAHLLRAIKREMEHG